MILNLKKIKILTGTHFAVISMEKNLWNKNISWSLMMRCSYKFILSTNNYRVTTAINGKEALEKVIDLIKSNNKIDLIITDILLPELNGIDFIKELKKNNINIPTFVISAYESKDVLNEVFELGSYEFINKPFNKETLLERLDLFFIKAS